MNGCQKPTEFFEYSRLDRVILMRDGFLEIDMVLSGLSVVSDVGFTEKNLCTAELTMRYLSSCGCGWLS